MEVHDIPVGNILLTIRDYSDTAGAEDKGLSPDAQVIGMVNRHHEAVTDSEEAART